MMDIITTIDLASIFVPSTSLAEAVLRGTLCYLFLFCVIRFLLKRQTGAVNIADLLMIVLLASAVQNALIGEQKSLPEGAVVILTIVFWNQAINWLGFHFSAIRRFSRPRAVQVIADGKVDKDRLRRELITTEELTAQLRLHGVSRIDEVSQAWVEGDGKFSVILKEPDKTAGEDNDDASRAIG